MRMVFLELCGTAGFVTGNLTFPSIATCTSMPARTNADNTKITGAPDSFLKIVRRARLEHALVIGVQTDLLFSVNEQQAVAGFLEAAGVTTRFAPLSCIEGHDAFLVDLETFGHEIGSSPRWISMTVCGRG